MGAEDLANRVARRFTAAERIAARFFEERYAKMMLAMSEPEAKKILGFPPHATPSKDEISKAYKAKVFENHPDRGGDLKKMVDVNVAKDFLDKHGPGGGAGAGDWVKDWYKNSPGGNPTQGQPRRERPMRWQDDPETKIVEGDDFAKAWSSSGAPPGTEWKFVSLPVYVYKQSYYPGESFFTLYGQTDTKHVFLCFKYRAEGSGVIPTEEYGPKTHFNADWQSSEIDVSIKLDPLKAIPKNIRSVSTGWPDPAPKHPLKFLAWPGGHPTEAILKNLHRGGVALKDILVGTGVLKDTDSGVAGRKTQVEVITVYNDKKSKAAREAIRAKGGHSYMSKIDQFDFSVRINGKEAPLDDATVRKMVPFGIEWDQIEDGRVTNLTRAKGSSFKGNAAYIIRKFADSLHTEPSWVHIAMEKAAEEYETAVKTASLNFRAGTTLFEAAYLEGISPHELFLRLHG